MSVFLHQFCLSDVHISHKCPFSPLYYLCCLMVSIISSATLDAVVCKIYLHLPWALNLLFVLFIESFLTPLDDHIFLSLAGDKGLLLSGCRVRGIQNDSVSFVVTRGGQSAATLFRCLCFPSVSTVLLPASFGCVFIPLCSLRSC